MKPIYRASNILEAQIVAGMLQAEGIDAEVAGYFLQGGVGELATQDFARVWLHDERDEARAKAVIAEYERGDRAIGEDDVD